MTRADPVEVGEQIPCRAVGPLDQADVIRFAGACGDFNPLHFDPELAQRAGFRAPVVMGQMSAGIVAGWLADWCGVEHLVDLEVRFVAPVLVGDALTLTGRVVDRFPDDGPGTARITFEAAVGEKVVLTGRAGAALGTTSSGTPRGA